jgi:2-oxoglutarate ferredoxin oxidoreductase subunit gamma
MEEKVTEIRFGGFGGQGIIRSGIIMGRAASIYDSKFATMNQSFGPEARGGACSSSLVISDDRVLYPYIIKSDILVALSQEGYEKFVDELKENGALLYDSNLVKPKKSKKIKYYSIPATKFAEELGNRIIANVVMLGFLIAIAKPVSVESMEKAIPESVPSRFADLNLEAFRKGFDFGLKLLKK